MEKIIAAGRLYGVGESVRMTRLLFKSLPIVTLCVLLTLSCNQRYTGNETPTCYRFPQDGGPGNVLIVRVTIAAKKYPFLLDTGASHTILDARLQEHVVPILGYSQNAGPNPVYSMKNREVSGFSLNQCKKVGCMDLSKLWESLEIECYGILGVDALQNSAIRIDQSRNLVEVFGSMPPLVQKGNSHPMTLDKYGRAEVECRVGKHQFTCVLDTGLLATIGLSRQEFDELFFSPGDLRAIRSIRAFSIENGAQDEVLRVGRCVGIRTLGAEMNDCVLREFHLSALGLYFLCRGCVTIDFVRREVWFDPNASMEIKDRSDMLGMTLTKRTSVGDFLVVEVASDSIAEHSGILVGDLINKCNDEDIRQMDYPEFRRRFTFEVSDPVELEVKRDGKSMNVRLN